MERCPQWDNHPQEYDRMGLTMLCVGLKMDQASGRWLQRKRQTEEGKKASTVQGWSSTFLIPP